MKIKFENGDFITLDEKVYPQESNKKEPEPEKEALELSKTATFFIAVFSGLVLLAVSKYLRDQNN